MLYELQIENIAVIKKAIITFSKGFNVMTGETGAGKSIVIDSINAVLGERTSRELIRTGSDAAFVSALFYDRSEQLSELLDELDIPREDDGEILIQRKLFADGRNTCKINGTTVTVSGIRKVAKLLVSIHGQLDNQTLLSPEYHCKYIDRLADDEDLLSAFHQSFERLQAIDAKLRSLNANESDKVRRLDILHYQIDELEKAEIRVGEMDELNERLTVLRNAEHIMELLQTAYAYLAGNDETKGAADIAMDAAKCLREAARFSSEYEEMGAAVEEAAYTLSGYCDDLRDRLYSDDFNPAIADEIEERLDLLSTLRKKYGDTEEEMLEFLETARKECDSIEMSDEIREKLQKERDKAYNEALSLAEQLSKVRKAASDRFCKQVGEELSFLDMPSVRFYVQNTPCALSENGIDNLEFILSANAGEEPKPLAKIASGGELSRIMLAIKSVLAEKDEIGTLIFDEIDTGVSGRAAQKIAIKLKKLSASHQVICVTHLAQIAAFGDAHLLIEKSEHDGQTFTDVTPLDFIGRKHELARILGGLVVTETQLKNAEELLLAAQNENIG